MEFCYGIVRVALLWSAVMENSTVVTWPWISFVEFHTQHGHGALFYNRRGFPTMDIYYGIAKAI
jgi:hypothetical protein